MTTQELQSTGYIFLAAENSIKEITYRDYLLEYGQDLTTSPHGVADRLHFREVKDDDGNTIEWQAWTWGVGGNHPAYTGYSFESEEEANLYYYERCEWFINEKNWDAPLFHSTEDEAITDFVNSVDRGEDVIRRYLSISKITAAKAAQRRAQIEKENEERRQRLAIEVPKEAATISVDDEFLKDMEAAKIFSSKEKSKQQAQAFSRLLIRQKIEIQTDFWQVFRIIKSKI